jgi:hypothetical protein
LSSLSAAASALPRPENKNQVRNKSEVLKGFFPEELGLEHCGVISSTLFLSPKEFFSLAMADKRNYINKKHTSLYYQSKESIYEHDFSHTRIQPLRKFAASYSGTTENIFTQDENFEFQLNYHPLRLRLETL